MKPAPASSVSVSASSPMMSAPDQRRTRMPAEPDRPPSFRISLTSVFETCSAGASPKMMPVPRQIAARNAITRPSIVNWIQYGLPTSCVAASNSRMPTNDSARPEHTGDERQEDALHQQLPHQAPARRANRHAHGDLTRALRRARQQQVGDVGAGDQEHEADRAHQRQEHGAYRAGVEALIEGLDVGLHVLVGVGIVARQALADREQLGLAPAAAPRRARGGRTLRIGARCASAARVRAPSTAAARRRPASET